MSVEGLPRVLPGYPSILDFDFDWRSRLSAPLGASLMSKDGMMELAGRIYQIASRVILIFATTMLMAYMLCAYPFVSWPLFVMSVVAASVNKINRQSIIQQRLQRQQQMGSWINQSPGRVLWKIHG